MDEDKRAKCREQLDLCDTGHKNVPAGISVSRTAAFDVDSRHLTTVIRSLLASDHTHQREVAETLNISPERSGVLWIKHGIYIFLKI